MRGGERLIDECSQMNGICSGLHHSTGIFCYPGARAIHQGIPKGKANLCPLGCLPCHNHGAASCGVFPSLGKPDWGKFYVVRLLGGFTGSCGELHGNALSIDRGLRCCSVRLNTAELNGNVKILCLEVVGEQLVVFALKPNINLNYFSFRSIGRNLGIFANQC